MPVWNLSECLMAMDDAAWERHSNPISGWSRITILPLMSAAIWSRAWLGWWAVVPILLVFIWTWLNPRLFRPPHSSAAWMTRAVLGERILLKDIDDAVTGDHRPVLRLLSYASGVGCLVMAIALWKLSLGFLLAGLVLAMGAKLWFLDRMVWLFEVTPGSATTSNSH